MNQNQQVALFFAIWWGSAALTMWWILWRMKKDATTDQSHQHETLETRQHHNLETGATVRENVTL